VFEKILIANRGEIACRIIRTCRRLGVKTVAVYSDADADSLHVQLADEAVRLGPPPAAQSYLLGDAIVAAAKATGAQAIHPGFGFLSEKAAFVEQVEAAGLVFVGPGAAAIAAMGDKIESKKLAAKAGVSTVPGHIGEIADADEALEIARGIGYPVMIKASAGGGGKGMRIAWTDQEVRDGFRSARNEARSSFGDERVFIEKFVEEPRHIEIQVLADGAGNTLYLWERECSIQRRHQKVLEEAPSPFLDEETRAAMGAQAVALCKAVGYRSAGTVEFIVDKHRKFYFLEMNTRLQVEHPVTEMITGLDLVEWMLRIADGETLPFGQDEVAMNGWAMEARLYAEDPTRNFLPSIGRLVRYSEPAQAEGVRVDSGVNEGAEISMYYDPMIAKLVTWGPDRAAAIARMQEALDAFYVRGINHNAAFLSAVMANPRFREGRLSTGFIAEEFPDGFNGVTPSGTLRRELAAVTALLAVRQRRRPAGEAEAAVVFLGEEAMEVTLTTAGEGLTVRVDGVDMGIQGDWRPGQPFFVGTVGGRAMTVQVDPSGAFFRLSHGGVGLVARMLRPRLAELAGLMPVKAKADLSKFILSPMPGLLVSLAVVEGQEVKAGEEIAVIEAMKMENVLRATADAKVATVHAKPGESLAVDQPIVEFA